MSEPGNSTWMQKVIPPRLLVPYLAGKRTIISGYVYRVQDCDRLTSPRALVDALDLTFEGSDLTSAVPELYLMRWVARDIDTYVVPYGAHMGGDWNDSPPFAGNGFTASREHVVPQFHTMPMPIPAGAEIVHITRAGERPFAAFDGLSWRPAA
ncbi:hypothetical protein [Acrocarpospora macrocephala]|uniref:Uncharacterized protein n=1 Tax=Acrocarpospora macrocephala TaxID=150177 RepID=A0A5M3WWD5_9ACTN|nr:hypothetical protein [Acrocarpospora macrocephala]GES13767.1 hypothetical protein Amac_073640 [Acrocarpospora macrocephala]